MLILEALIVTVAGVMGSFAIARRWPRLAIILSSLLVALCLGTGTAGYDVRNAKDFSQLYSIPLFFTAALALVCALILAVGALRSPARRYVAVLPLPTLAMLVALHISHVSDEKQTAFLHYMGTHGEIRYREDCVRALKEYHAACLTFRMPAPPAPLYTSDGHVDWMATRRRDRELGATWGRTHHATGITDCYKVLDKLYESWDLVDGCQDYVKHRD